MSDPTSLALLIALGVVGFIGTLGFVFARSSGSVAEQRLDGLSTGKAKARTRRTLGVGSIISG